MARGVNKVILLGNVGGDPEIFDKNGGGIIAKISIATNESWKDREGNKQERTEWHTIIFFDRLAEVVEEYVEKGMTLYVEGKLSTRKWQDKDGNDRYSTEVIAQVMQMIGGGKDENRGGRSGRDNNDRDRGGRGGRGNDRSSGRNDRDNGGNDRQSRGGGNSRQPAKQSSFDDFDDDIPF